MAGIDGEGGREHHYILRILPMSNFNLLQTN